MALYAFDGTWNREHTGADYSKNTNVVKFAKAYLGRKVVFQKKGKKEHVVEDDDAGYIDGPGARHGPIGWFFGHFGAGGKKRVREGLALVERKFAEGDPDVDVVGFSRGASIALDFVNELADRQIPVRFLGLWDVVGAFGIPINIGPFHFQSINVGWRLTLPPTVEHCFHAIALDERREAFRVTRVPGAYEVWFRGVHADVGGGNENEALSNISLAWMLRKAAAVNVPVDLRVIDGLTMDPDTPVQPKDDDQSDFRDILPPVWVHHTIRVKEHPDCRPVHAEWPVETAEHEATRTRI